MGRTVGVGLVLGMVLQTAVAAAGSGDRLVSPVRLAVAGKGTLLVSDYRQKAVLVIDDRSLAVRRRLAVTGRPLAVGWAAGRLYVGNETTGLVEVYNEGGKLLTRFGETGAVPSDLAVDAGSGAVFVVDSAARLVRVYDGAGNILRFIGGPAADNRLYRPTGIVLDEAGQQVLVSDFGSPEAGIAPRVMVYDYTGAFRRLIPGTVNSGMLGSTALFSRPQGMALDGRGHLYLVDSLLGQVLVLDLQSGALVKTIGSFGTAPGELQLPLDVIIDGDGADLLVTNNRSGRIERFYGGAL